MLISACYLGGAGGAERALQSILRALAIDDVDVVVRTRLGGPLADVPRNARVFTPSEWRWRGSLEVGIKGFLINRLLRPMWKGLLPEYDVYLRYCNAPDVGNTVRARVRLLIPAGNKVSRAEALGYDYVAMESPDNAQLVPEGIPTTLLMPPVYPLSDHAEPPSHSLPDNYFLTVFNPYDEMKGADILLTVVDSLPLPLVWCHSQATINFAIPEALKSHVGITHIDDATQPQLRYLYENCSAYIQFSRSEGFGWSAADALRYAPGLYSLPIGVLCHPEAKESATTDRNAEPWNPGWNFWQLTETKRDGWVMEDDFRRKLLQLVSPLTGSKRRT